MTRIENGLKVANLVGVKTSPTNIELKAVTVRSAATKGTVTVGAGSTILGIVPSGSQDRYVDNVAISGTTLTVTFAAAATANNTFHATVLEP